MEFESRNDSTHDGLRFSGAWLWALGLALVVVGAGTLLLTAPTVQQKPVVHAARLP